jgi:murein DD-endopeptidase MepM/ murein hydrolase activator NlpD
VKRSLALGLCLAGAGMLLAIGGQAIRSAAAPLAVPGAAAEFGLVGEFTQGGWARGTAPAGAVALTLDGKPVPMAADRGFFLAFDRDAGTTATLVARLADGRSLSRALAVSARAWKLEYIPIGPKPGALPDPEFIRRRAAEVAQINAARAIDSHSQGWRQHFIWPVHGRISGLFGSQRIYRGTPGAYHSGTDIAGGTGTPILTPADGVVILAAASPFTLEGNLLMVDHGMGLNSAFLHCSQLLVHQGEAVKQGQLIARIGMTGRATGPHLHWSLKWRDARLDPMLFAGPMR